MLINKLRKTEITILPYKKLDAKHLSFLLIYDILIYI